MEKSIIQQDIKYFVNNYSLIELFCGIWTNCSVLKGSNESHKKALTIISTATKRRVTKNGMRDLQTFCF